MHATWQSNLSNTFENIEPQRRHLGVPVSDANNLNEDPTSPVTSTSDSLWRGDGIFLEQLLDTPPLSLGTKAHSKLVHLPLGIILQRDCWPQLIFDCSFWGINDKIVKLSPAGAMQFDQALEWLLFCIWYANHCFGPTYRQKSLEDTLWMTYQQGALAFHHGKLAHHKQ